MRWPTNFAVVAVLALFAVAAIAVSAQLPFSYGVIQSSCAPWDGPAVEMTLTTRPMQCKQTSEPYLEIGVWRGLPLRSGQSFKFGPSSDTGFASRCAKMGDCERAESGTVVFEKYQDGSGAAGRYELHFKGGEVLNGTFEAKWCENHMLCR